MVCRATQQNLRYEGLKPITTALTTKLLALHMGYHLIYKYHIFFDLTNSYFQVPMSKTMWPYLGVMTPYRGLRVLTRAGQGLQNSDTELEQLICLVLGDDITAGYTLIARDDGIIGGDIVEVCNVYLQ